MGNLWEEGSAFLYEIKVFQAEMYVVLACVYGIQMNVWPEKYVFVLIVRLPKYLHWYDSAKRHCMISLPATLWVCIGSQDMLGCKEMKSPARSQVTVLFKSLFQLSCPWESLGRISKVR